MKNFQTAWVLLGLLMIGPYFAPAQRKANPNPSLGTQTIPLPNGSLFVSAVEIQKNGRLFYLHGSLTNRTNKDWEYLRLNLNWLVGDQQMGEFETLEFGALKAGDTHRFGILGDGHLLTTGPAAGVPITSAIFSLADGIYPVTYRFSLLKPKQGPLMTVVESEFRIILLPSRQGIQLDIENSTESVLELDWNRSAFVAPDGTSGKVLHDKASASDARASLPPTIVPPGTRFRGLVFSAGSVVEDRLSRSGYRLAPMLPDGPSSSAMVGRAFGIVLAIQGASKPFFDYRFQVESVDD